MPTPDPLSPGSTEAGPRTELELLLARPGAYGNRLDVDVDTIAAHLPLLDECVAMTANGAALISQLAPYAPPTFTGDPLSQPPGTVTVRMHRPAMRAFVAMDADDDRREPPGLWMFDGESRALHRAYLVSNGGALALDLLRLARRAPEPDPSDDPVSDWTTDQLGMLDSILADGGVSFRAALPGIGPGLRTRIEPRQVVDLLGYLCHTGVPLTIGVPHRGCAQLYTGLLDAVEPQGHVVSIVAGSANAAFHPADVADAWIVRSHGVHGPTSMLQLYDAGGRCVLLVTQIGMVGAGLAAAWEEIVGGLPGYGS